MNIQRTLLIVLGCLVAGHPWRAFAAEPWAKRSVVEVSVADVAQFEELHDLESRLPGFEVWSHGMEQPTTLLIRAADLAGLQRFRPRVVIDDWDKHRAGLRAARLGLTFFDSYHDYDEYIAYLEQLAADFPALATILEVGQSVQGRTIKGIRITGAQASVPGVFFHGVQHGNELTNAPVLVYTADYLLRNYATDDHVRALVDGTDWYLIPISNPDGHEAGTRRNANDVDLNRDWASILYPEAFHQPETAALRDFLLARPHIQWHIDFHTGVQMVLWSWGYTPQRAWDHFVYDGVAESISTYTRGPIYSTLYSIVGGANDYVYGALGIMSLTVESSSAYAVPPSSLDTYEARMLNLMLDLVSWLRDCNGDGQPNAQLDCLRPVSNLTELIQCLSPIPLPGLDCDDYDWDQTGDVTLRDFARLANRFRPRQ